MSGHLAGGVAEVPVPTCPIARQVPLTFGIEEEFVLLDPTTGGAKLAAPDMMRLLGGQPGFDYELKRFQFETATGVCTSLDDGRAELHRLRQTVANAAESLGCRLVASGVPPYGTPGTDALNDVPRYHEMARRFPALIATGGTQGCHVHVGVPSRELGVQALARLRPWLASLLAISANSPIADGHDTGWASRRYPVWCQWPTARPPEAWPDAAAYNAAVRGLIQDGAAMDEANVYFHARLSPRYPIGAASRRASGVVDRRSRSALAVARGASEKASATMSTERRA
jgi:glutamate---cysteine ligase / carboxylate-amine ligase